MHIIWEESALQTWIMSHRKTGTTVWRWCLPKAMNIKVATTQLACWLCSMHMEKPHCWFGWSLVLFWIERALQHGGSCRPQLSQTQILLHSGIHISHSSSLRRITWCTPLHLFVLKKKKNKKRGEEVSTAQVYPPLLTEQSLLNCRIWEHGHSYSSW